MKYVRDQQSGLLRGKNNLVMKTLTLVRTRIRLAVVLGYSLSHFLPHTLDDFAQ